MLRSAYKYSECLKSFSFHGCCAVRAGPRPPHSWNSDIPAKLSHFLRRGRGGSCGSGYNLPPGDHSSHRHSRVHLLLPPPSIPPCCIPPSILYPAPAAAALLGPGVIYFLATLLAWPGLVVVAEQPSTTLGSFHRGQPGVDTAHSSSVDYYTIVT